MVLFLFTFLLNMLYSKEEHSIISFVDEKTKTFLLLSFLIMMDDNFSPRDSDGSRNDLNKSISFLDGLNPARVPF